MQLHWRQPHCTISTTPSPCATNFRHTILFYTFFASADLYIIICRHHLKKHIGLSQLVFSLYYSVISSTYLSEKFFLKTKNFLGTFPKVEVLKAPTSTLLSCRWEGLWLLQMPNGASQQLDRGKEKCKSSPSFSSAFPNAKYVVVLGSYVHTMYIPNPLFLMQNMRVH